MTPSPDAPAVHFSATFQQPLSTCVHLLGSSVLAYCLSRRTPRLGPGSWSSWASLTWARLCVILVLLDSWLFIFFSGVLVNGVGLAYSRKTCALAIYACITFYCLSKVLIYGFLVERVYIVWSGGNQTPRFRTPAYRICSVVLMGYVAILILMVIAQISRIRPDGICMIGLEDFATIPMIAYDLSLNVFLTGMFLWPLIRSRVVSPKLKSIAKRTLYGAFASLTTSAVNVIVLVALKGEELGWVCLASCVTDVSLNAIVLAWVTAQPHPRPMIPFDRFSLPTMDVGPLSTTLPVPSVMLGETRMERPLDGLHSNIPASYFDYIPHEPTTSPDSGSPRAIEHSSMDWLRNLVSGLRRPKNGMSERLQEASPSALESCEKSRTMVGTETGCQKRGDTGTSS